MVVGEVSPGSIAKWAPELSRFWGLFISNIGTLSTSEASHNPTTKVSNGIPQIIVSNV
jgi:hypothetical protein